MLREYIDVKTLENKRKGEKTYLDLLRKQQIEDILKIEITGEIRA
jgi:hypothetical protein